MFTKLLPSLLSMVTAVICANGLRFPALLAARQTPCSSTYTVVSGDTCDSIAVENNVTAAALEAANPDIDAQCDNLFIGESLCIPAGAASVNSTCQPEFIVQSGDDCFDIANQFNITVAALEAANSQIDPLCDNLLPGEGLCIPPASS
ncbi:hypothetical protein BDP27DRAFT_1318601 [Rhodocollybia butyracea]|uniref:LysM domain-containing protein n=1 Tax=Rhodocollybia butyracea TaxID=206335 RepID=A0A9P5UC07_9AGAR|nr:hypothetical protein BDP27DRAFT_1318601 [Rhodocollybia butyracea]